MPPTTLCSPRHGFRWVVCALLFLATTINYADRQVLSLVKEFLDADFHWTKAQFGLINSLFQGAYALGILWFGWFVDKHGVRKGYALSMIGWSLAAMMHGSASFLPHDATVRIGTRILETSAVAVGCFGFLRVLLGLSEAGNFPSAVTAVARWFPVRERALATSLFNSGSNVGAIAAPMLVPLIALTLGWSWAFVLIGASGFLWLLFWLRLYSDPAESSRTTQAELALIHSGDPAGQESPSIPWLSLLRYRQTWSFVAAKFLTDPIWWFFLIWLPDFFKETRHLEIKKSWLLLAAIYSIVTVLSIGGGWLTGHLAGQGWSITRARRIGMLIFAVMALPISFVGLSGNWTAVLLIGLAGAAHQAWSATIFSTVSDMFPRSCVAGVVGIGGMAGSVAGILFPLATGFLLDHYKASGEIGRGYSILFIFCSLTYLLALALNTMLAPSLKPVTAPAR